MTTILFYNTDGLPFGQIVLRETDGGYLTHMQDPGRGDYHEERYFILSKDMVITRNDLLVQAVADWSERITEYQAITARNPKHGEKWSLKNNDNIVVTVGYLDRDGTVSFHAPWVKQGLGFTELKLEDFLLSYERVPE